MTRKHPTDMETSELVGSVGTAIALGIINARGLRKAARENNTPAAIRYATLMLVTVLSPTQARRIAEAEELGERINDRLKAWMEKRNI